jgi:hypothetical protein
MPKQKRTKRKTNQPAQKRYVSENRRQKNRDRRVARILRGLKAAAAVRPRTEARKAARRAAQQTTPTTAEEGQ